MTRHLDRRQYVAGMAGIGATALGGCLDGGPGSDEPPDESDTEPGADDSGEDDEEVDHENPEGEVWFEQPEDGETVSSPVEISMAVEEFELEPVAGTGDEGDDDGEATGEDEEANGNGETNGDEEGQEQSVQDGQGHLHVLVDVGCVEPIEPIPFEEGYHHLGEGGTDITLDLEPGEYDLCAQASDGDHIAYDMTDEISIEVEDE
ncbi:DUF4399 domain-containing protein [Halobacteria archaeon AArc-dxtr1]|nr:DUF4399 domain-containing protein [Halobacteria archaeon AArc-dxtr1]